MLFYYFAFGFSPGTSRILMEGGFDVSHVFDNTDE